MDFSTPAGMADPANKGLTYADLALKNAQKIMSIAAPFAASGNQTIENLAHLKEGEIVGEWRDSTYGGCLPPTNNNYSPAQDISHRYRRRPSPLRRQHRSRPRCAPQHRRPLPSRHLRQPQRLGHTGRQLRPSLGRLDPAVLPRHRPCRRSARPRRHLRLAQPVRGPQLNRHHRQ